MKFLRSLRAIKPSRLLLAVVLSVLAHLVALFADQVDLSRPPSDLAPLEARLIRAAPDAKRGAAPVAKPKPPVPAPAPAEAPEPAKAESEEAPTRKAEEAQPLPEKLAEAEPQPETPAVTEPPKAVGHLWPRAGLIRYVLFGGEGRDPAANSNAELRWEIEPDGRYKMSLVSRDAKPFPTMPWFTISFSYASRGVMVDGLFKPDRYEEAISVFHSIAVNFDWEKMSVDFAGHNLPLQPGTVDYLTVIMQAGDPGFIERGVMSVATGRGLRQYKFEAMGEEALALPFGKTWKVRQLFGKTGNNDVRIWVATEQFNLPVQIRFVVNKVSYYLIATEVLVAREAADGQPMSQVAAVPSVTVPTPAVASPALPTLPTERPN